MRIYNATKATMNLPMANGSRLIIGSKEMSRQFYPTVELLNLLVSAYSMDDIAIIIDSSAEISMGATVSALPGYVVKDTEEALMKFKEKEDLNKNEMKPTEKKDSDKQQVKSSNLNKSVDSKQSEANK